MVLKRCVDVDDLLAAATAGQADVAVVGARRARAWTRAAVDHLRRHGVRPVAIVAGGAPDDAGGLRAARIGIRRWSAEDELDALPDAVTADARPTTVARRRPTRPVGAAPPVAGPGGRRLGPGRGAGTDHGGHRRSPPSWPGGGVDTVLVDADPYGGAVAQQLGILDEVSGLLVGGPAGRRRRCSPSGSASVQRGLARTCRS